MRIREIVASELSLIRDIDRSEHITEQYFFRNGELHLRSVDIQTTGFDLGEFNKIIHNQGDILESGGSVFGTFKHDELLGVASLDNRLFGDEDQFAKMDILYVSANHRGKGIGKSLVETAKKEAQEFGAKRLYVSATPTRSTVDFYLNLGAVLLLNPDTKLFDLEPEDIHLSLEVN